ncbi:MAG: EscU/YscU/HrcU family type III secretion system export apparatus switch protein [Spirochaetales bacterium]|nr:EscU/YscU/HrcU family type III secretion system export apparatus switch protein [Spirochaetales bacterium]
MDRGTEAAILGDPGVNRDIPRAAALRYSPDLPAPFLLCKGRGEAAVRLLREAEKAGIPLVRDPGVLEGLLELEPWEFIPEEMFGIIAEILGFVYSLENGPAAGTNRRETSRQGK